MLYRGIVCACMFVVLLLPSWSDAQSQEIREYKVSRGDTLWGISGKELSDTFLWPKIWKENQEISNPDRIYPGQTIRIPLYLLKKEKQDEPAVAASAKQEPVKSEEPAVAAPAKQEPVRVVLKPLVERSIIIGGGYLAEGVRGIGRVDGSPGGRKVFGNNDIVYVRMNTTAKLGDKFFIIGIGPLVKHPTTGKSMGNIIELKGIAQVVRFEYGETLAKVLEMFDDIEVGDPLAPFYETEPPLTAGAFRKPDIRGTVVAAKSRKTVNGNYDIVYLDKGLKDGVEVGDILQTLNINTHTVPNSRIQVISLRETTATAIVRTFTSPVDVGDVTVRAE